MTATGLNPFLDFQSFSLQSLARTFLRANLELHPGRNGHRAAGVDFAPCTRTAELGHALCSLVLGLVGDRGASPVRHWFQALSVSDQTVRDHAAGTWALYIFAGWAMIATAGLVRLGFGFWRLRQLRKSCVPVDITTLDPPAAKDLGRVRFAEETDALRIRSAARTHGDRVHQAAGRYPGVGNERTFNAGIKHDSVA